MTEFRFRYGPTALCRVNPCGFLARENLLDVSPGKWASRYRACTSLFSSYETLTILATAINQRFNRLPAGYCFVEIAKPDGSGVVRQTSRIAVLLTHFDRPTKDFSAILANAFLTLAKHSFPILNGSWGEAQGVVLVSSVGKAIHLLSDEITNQGKGSTICLILMSMKSRRRRILVVS